MKKDSRQSKIELFESHKISSLVKEYNRIQEQSIFIDSFKNHVDDKINTLTKSLNNLELDLVIESKLFEGNSSDILISLKKLEEGYNSILESVKENINELSGKSEKFSSELIDAHWRERVTNNEQKFKIELDKINISNNNALDVTIIAKEKAEKESKLREFKLEEDKVSKLKLEKDEIQKRYFDKAKEVSNFRRDFLKEINTGGNVKIKLNRFRDKISFENQIRQIINRDIGFESDINDLVDSVFKGNIEEKLEEFRLKIRDIVRDERTVGVTKYLNNLFSRLESTQVDQLQLLIPDDDISIVYKPKNDNKYIPLTSASAGQKATAILTFLLSFGDYPLILDQPEDDLNGKLVYELIVDRIKVAKSKRQIIVVTHNANIPVNADSELIICLSSTEKNMTINRMGTIDIPEIKKEVCDVMEGSVDAFMMRAKRYSSIKKLK